MVGKTRLYQHTGSPLIRGRSRGRSPLRRLLIVLAVVALVAGVAAFVYLTYLQ